MPPDDGKRCSTCREVLPPERFARRQASADGLQHICRGCAAEYARRTRPRSVVLPPDVEPGRKWCRRCESVKDLDDFPLHRSTSDGRQTYCRTCFADIYRERRARHGYVVRPADVPPGHKYCRACQQTKPISEWPRREKNADGVAFRCRECMSARDRRRHLATSYGLTPEAAADLKARQNGRCIICLRAPAVHVDHDHVTGEVRGVLCFRCNAGLGQLGDSPHTLRRAADYLEGRRLELREVEPGVVRIIYPAPPDPAPATASAGSAQPMVDISALREMARRHDRRRLRGARQ